MKRLLPAVAAFGFVLALPGVALGYWLSSGNQGEARATAAVLPPAAAPVPVAVHRHSVTLSLAPVAGADGYLVHRYAGDTAVASLRCSLRCVDAGVPDGSWRYTATALRGRWSGPASPLGRAVVVDTTAPRLSITSAPATNDRTALLTGTGGTAPGDQAKVTVRVFSGAKLLLVRTVPVRDGGWQYQLPKLSAQHRYGVLVRQGDAVGNVGALRSSLVIDTLAPVIWLAPAAPDRVSGLAGTVPDSARASADSPAVTVQFRLGGQLVRSVVTTRTGARFTVGTTGLASGRYQVRAQQRDAAGNIGTSNVRTVTIDATPPKVTVEVPAWVRSSPVLRGCLGTAAGDHREVRVRLTSDGRTVLDRLVRTTGSSWRLPLPELTPNQRYSVEVSQSDDAGNIGRADGGFVLDTVAPAPTLGYTDGVLAGTAGIAPGSDTTSPDDTTVKVLFYQGDSTSGRPARIRRAEVVDGRFTVADLPADGRCWTVVVRQRDAAGNTGYSAPVQFGAAGLTPPPAD